MLLCKNIYLFIAAKNCGNPGNIVNGTKSGISYYYPDTVTYSCNNGFQKISGDAIRTCQDDGSWSGTAPVCERCSGSGINAVCKCK